MLRTLCVLGCFWSFWSVEAAAAATQTVVLIDASSPRTGVNSSVIDGVLERLSSEYNVSLSVEHLNLLKQSSGADQRAVGQVLLARYGGKEIDALIVLESQALDFVLSMRRSAFGNAPIIFGATSSKIEATAGTIPDVTGVIGDHDLHTNVKLILRHHPNLERIYVVNGDDRALEREIIIETERRFAGIDFIPLAVTEVSALEVELGRLQDRSAVLLVDLPRNAGGLALDRNSVIVRLGAATDAPVYGVYEEALGYGIVGGYLQSTELLGRTLAEITMSVLNGASAGDIPILREAPHRYMFDFRQLNRFGLNLADVPLDSVVTEEPDTFYYRYRPHFFTALAVFAAAVFYIFQLSLSIRKRKRMQEGLERIMACGEHPLQPGRAALDEVNDRLTAAVPSLRPISAWRTAGGSLTPIPEAGAVSHSLSDLADMSFLTHRSQFGEKEAAVFLPSPPAPIGIVGVRASRSLDQIDRGLIDMAARNLAYEYGALETARITQSLQTAHDIQMGMLPREPGTVAAPYGLESVAVLRPASAVGGDIYDVFSLDADRLCFFVGDAAGKGVPASLFMALTKSAVRAAADIKDGPACILEHANNLIARENVRSYFVTLSLGVFDRTTGVLRIANAGHHNPLLRSGGQWAEISVPKGMALGIIPGQRYKERELLLDYETVLFVASDGVSDAVNEQGDFFGANRLHRFLQNFKAATARDVVDATLNAVDAYAGAADQFDDITILCLRRHPSDATTSGRLLKAKCKGRDDSAAEQIH